MLRKLVLILNLLLCPLFPMAAAAPGERAVMVREASIYISPDTAAQKIGTVGRGREVAIIEKSHDFLNVFANVESGNPELMQPGRDITGWFDGDQWGQLFYWHGMANESPAAANAPSSK